MIKFAKLISILSALLFTQVSFSQHVIGFFPNWRNAGDENKIQYDKITDIIYCFIQPDASGNFPQFSSWSSSDQTKFNNIKTNAAANNVRVRISSGGAGSAYMYSPLAANATYRQNFAASVANFIVANNIDGFDVDWEFPSNAERGNLDLLLAEFRSEFNKKESAGYRHIYLGIDVGGEQGHTNYFTTKFVDYCDEVNIMAYDLAGGFSSVTLANKSFDIWKTYLGASNAKKLVQGVPFYTSNQGMYNGVAYPYATNASKAYDGTISGYTTDGTNYNAAPALKSKIDYVMTNGGGGVMIWELSQDILDANYYQYSLLSAINLAIAPYKITCESPNLGPDVSLCGVGSVNLTTGLSAKTGRTFTWYKDGTTTGANSPSLNSISSAGKYWVVVDSVGKCQKVDTIKVSSTIGTINLGSTTTLCSNPTDTLDAGISGAGISYSWYKDNALISGQTAKTLIVNTSGTYKVSLSANGCSSVSGSVVVSSNLVNVPSVEICKAGAVTLQVTDAGSNYDWFSSQTGGAALKSGSATYSTNVSSNTSFYVGRANTLTNTTLGKTSISGWAAGVVNYANKFQLSKASTLVSVNFVAGAAGNVTLVILANDGSTQVATKTVSVVSGENTALLNILLPAETYYIYANSAPAGTLTMDGTASATDYVSNGITLYKNTYDSWSGAAFSTAGTNSGFFYNFKFTSGSGDNCARTKVDVIINPNCNATGIEDVENYTFQLYPNPSKGSLNIKSETKISKIQILNALGSIVREFRGENISENSLSLEGLPKGYYIVKINDSYSLALVVE
ncbi:MAG: endoglucanase-related protein glucosyl hydrolase family 9 protein [Bacteroidota bacterium]|jgi:hypothetical protein